MSKEAEKHAKSKGYFKSPFFPMDHVARLMQSFADEQNTIEVDTILKLKAKLQKAEEKLQAVKDSLMSDEEIKEHFTTEHSHYQNGRYRRVRLDRIEGAKQQRDRTLKALNQKALNKENEEKLK